MTFASPHWQIIADLPNHCILLAPTHPPKDEWTPTRVYRLGGGPARRRSWWLTWCGSRLADNEAARHLRREHPNVHAAAFDALLDLRPAPWLTALPPSARAEAARWLS